MIVCAGELNMATSVAGPDDSRRVDRIQCVGVRAVARAGAHRSHEKILYEFVSSM